MSPSLPALEQRFAADLAKAYNRIATLETQMTQAIGAFAAFACTSATRPATPRTGQEILETDTGTTAVYSGTAWLHGATQVGTVVLGASATSITVPVPTACTHLTGVFALRTDTGSGGAFTTMRFNADAGNNYTWNYLYGSGGAAAAGNSGALVSSIRFAVAPGSGDTASYFATGGFDIAGASAAIYKTVASRFQGPMNSVSGYSGTAGGLWQSTAVVTSVTVLPNAGNFVAGSVLTLYGLM